MSIDPKALKFYLLSSDEYIPADAIGWSGYLDIDYWDDWRKYRTQFYLTMVDPDGHKHRIGQLKIGSKGLKPHSGGQDIPSGHRYPDLKESFKMLDEGYFSLGQDEEYYENLRNLPDVIRERILTALKDVAADSDLWNWARNEYVMEESLLRYITSSTVEGQFRRMARGDARATRYEFSYSPPKRLGDGAPPFKLQFSVDPNSAIPTNVHVLIGRNGVGKTRLLSLMTKALVAKDATAKQSGKFELSEEGTDSGKFANVVTVSFSAFDEAELLPERNPSPDALGFSFIGLLGRTGESPTSAIRPKSPQMLANEFVTSLRECRVGSRRRRWTEVISVLQSDPVFKAAHLTDIIDADLSKKEELEEVLGTFKALSSGHKIVLLTLTRLVEKVEERTLVLIDEPEGHLHPPLLSAMTRAISELLVKRNGVAVIATHSPIILQEVPKSCAWIINRILSSSKAERPSIETFGESVGILSREVFQLELSQSGYQKILNHIKSEAATYEKAMAMLKNELGAEAKAILRAMYLNDLD